MNNPAVLITAICCILTACQHPDRPSTPAGETPKALEHKGSLDQIKMSRGSENLIESIYSDLVEKDTTLKALERSITGIREKSTDSLELFQDYNQKNEAYYNLAADYIAQIKDSVLRIKIKAIVDNSRSAYHQLISRHQKLMKDIEDKSTALQDLHIALKLRTTRAAITRYQTSDLPSSSPLQQLVAEYEQLIQKTDSLARRP